MYNLSGAGLIKSRPDKNGEVNMIANKIKVTRGCSASGKSLEAGKIYSVPEDISEVDAAILISMKKAEYIQTVEDVESIKKEKKRKAK